MHIAIVGAGMAGMQVLARLLQDTVHTITIFDREPYAGRGLPFIRDEYSLLLNQPSEQMSLRGATQDFQSWLDTQRPQAEAERRFASRWAYGDYAGEIFQTLLQSPRVSWQQRWIEDLSYDGSHYTLTDDEGDRWEAEQVHLCAGLLPPKDPWNLRGSPDYDYHPYPISPRSDSLLACKRLGLLGTGLTTLDLLTFLHSSGYEGELLFIGQSGDFPTIRGPKREVTAPHYEQALRAEQPSLRGILDAFCRDCVAQGVQVEELLNITGSTEEQLKYQQEHLADFAIVQQMLSVALPARAHAWNKLSLHEQLFFNTKYRSLFKRLQSPMPPETAEILSTYLQSGQAQVVTDVEAIVPAANGGFLIHVNEKARHVERIVNTTGSRHRLMNLTADDLHQAVAGDAAIAMPGWGKLLIRLLDSKLLQADPLGGVSVLYPSLAAISPRYGVLEDLRIYGDAVSGIHFANNAVSLVAAPE